MDCPKCQVELERVKATRHAAYLCNECSGHICEQRGVSTLASDSELLSATGAQCPKCGERKMAQVAVPMPQSEATFNVEHCDACHVAWYSAEELSQAGLSFENAVKTVDTAIFQSRVDKREAAEEEQLEKHVHGPRPGYEGVFSGFGLWLLIGGLAAIVFVTFVIWFYSSTGDFTHPSTRQPDAHRRPGVESE